MPRALRVVLDCDTKNEVDDQFAIAHALGSPETLDVRAVISCHNTTADGPLSRDLYQEEAKRVVALCGGSVPCLRGAPLPMEDRRTPVGSEGLDFLVEEARQGPLTLVATGPATDVASLLLAAPEVRENLRVVWLGGFGDEGTYGRWEFRMGELNGRADIAAWRLLLEDPVGLLQVPGWPGPYKIAVEPEPFAEELRALGRPVADYLAEILIEETSENGGEGEGGRKVIWDLACTAAVVDPGAVRTEPLTVPALDAAGGHDWREGSRGREVEAVVDLDAARVLGDLRAALARHPVSTRP
jgi:inosine-uridine nucleoside N-ribohydrolase